MAFSQCDKNYREGAALCHHRNMVEWKHCTALIPTFRSRPCTSCAGVVDARVAHTTSDVGYIILHGTDPQHVYTHSLDSCGHLDSAYVPPGLHKPAPFIIFQHPCSNWATSPSAVTHHFLRGEHMKRYRCTWSGTDLSRCGGFCIWIAYVDSWALRWHRADPGTALCFFSPVDACLYLYPQWCGSLVMMWPISLHGDKATAPLCRRQHGRDLCHPFWQGH